MQNVEKIDYIKMYENCKDFKDYVDRYVSNKDLTVEVAFEHSVVKEYADWLISKGVC